MTPTADPAAIADLVPSFWTATYGGQDVVASAIRGVAACGRATADAVARLATGLAPATADPLWRDRFLPWTLAAADRELAPPIAYGDGSVFGPQPDSGDTYTFGGPRDASVSYPLPADFVDLAAVADRLASPTRLWVAGVDCAVVDGRLTFVEDPLGAADELAVWLVDAAADRADLRRRFGTVLGLAPPSTPAGRDEITAAYAAASQGASDLSIRNLIAGATGLPCVQTDGEVVELVLADAAAVRIVTDAAAYVYPAAVTPLVATGDVLRAGDWPVTGVQVLPVGQLTPAVAGDVVLPAALTGLAGPVTIPNRPVATVVVVDAEHAYVKWAMGGDAAVVAAFFSAADAAGEAAGLTIGDVLDPRPFPRTPLEVAVPTTINPFATLVAHAGWAGVLAVVVSTAVIATDALAELAAARQLFPPHVAVLLCVDPTPA